MRRHQSVAILAGIAIVASVVLAAPASAQLDDQPSGTLHTPTEEGRVPTGPVPTEGVVVYWGFTEEGKFFQTQPLDASVPAHRGVKEPARTLPLDGTATPTYFNEDGTQSTQSPPTIQSLYCERYVSAIRLQAGDLQGDVDQRCTGSYQYHWVSYRFERDSWRGWLGYTGWNDSTTTRNYRYVWTFAVDCGAPGDTGIYNYRLNTRGYARHTDGTVVAGSPVWGQSGRYACGGGDGS